MPEEKFEKKCGPGTAAITIGETRCIIFSEDSVDLATVIHECVHAYYSDLCVGSADLTSDQIEEVFAEMFSQYGDEIIKQSRKLLKALKKEIS